VVDNQHKNGHLNVHIVTVIKRLRMINNRLVKKLIHDNKMRISPKAIDLTEREVEYVLKIAMARATQDRRRTVDAQDVLMEDVIKLKNKWGII